MTDDTEPGPPIDHNTIDALYYLFQGWQDERRRRKLWAGFTEKANEALNKTSRDWFAGRTVEMPSASTMRKWFDEMSDPLIDAAAVRIAADLQRSGTVIYTYDPADPALTIQRVELEDFYDLGEATAMRGTKP